MISVLTLNVGFSTHFFHCFHSAKPVQRYIWGTPSSGGYDVLCCLRHNVQPPPPPSLRHAGYASAFSFCWGGRNHAFTTESARASIRSRAAPAPRCPPPHLSAPQKQPELPHAAHISPTQKMSVNVIIIGPPGSGVRTQALRLARHRPMPILSSGLLLREAVADAHSPLGRRAKLFLDAGKVRQGTSHARSLLFCRVIYWHSLASSAHPRRNHRAVGQRAHLVPSPALPCPPLPLYLVV
jgi:hypothetical protein